MINAMKPKLPLNFSQHETNTILAKTDNHYLLDYAILKRRTTRYALRVLLLLIVFLTFDLSTSLKTNTRLLSPRVIRTKYGSLRGVVINLSARGLGDAEAFLGVPYAAPPVGNLRFMPPGSPAPWRDIKIAEKLGSVCPQRLPDLSNETAVLEKVSRIRLIQIKKMIPYLRNQSEDCLHLNIYTPSGASTRNFQFPVMVYIHGESYEWNSGNPYDGSILASFGQVVVVTINFRLGILGFLNTNDHPHERSIANYGLMDQIAALHWLKQNVADFGGDPNNVTIFGHGTGAACINFLMTSRAVPKNLFHRVILMSGSSLAPWALVSNPRTYTKQIAKALNCSVQRLGETLKKCLKKKPLHAIMEAQVEVPEFYYAFGPSVDGVLIETELDTNPQSYISRLSSYDIMFGVTPGDAFLSLNERDVRFGLETEKRNKILRTFIRNTYNFHLTEILATVINEYTDWDRPGNHPISTRDETLSLLSDALFAAPVVHTGSLYASTGRSSYLYVFDHFTRSQDYSRSDLSLERMGSILGEELPYVWGAPLASDLNHFSNNFTQAEVKLSEAILAFWSNFARTGNPNDITQSEEKSLDNSRYRSVEWPTYDAKYRKYLAIGLKPRVKDHYRSHQLSFWLQLVPQLHRAGENAPEDHNHLSNHNDWSSYRGYVRSEPVTRVILPPITTTAITTTRQYNVSAVLQSTPIAKGESERLSPSMKDGFAAYSTALSVTIAIGCSLLILNVLIFAGVYYQRDKSRSETKKISENGGLLASHSISGDINTPSEATSIGGAKVDVTVTTLTTHGSNGSSKVTSETSSMQGSKLKISQPIVPMGHTHLPPPEFADYPVVTSSFSSAGYCPTLPRTNARHATCDPNGALTLSVTRAPAPPRIPGLVSEAQPLLQQSSFSIASSPQTSSNIKSPVKEQDISELKV